MKHIHKIGAYFCLVATAIFLMNGCATIFKGSTDTVNFSSNPSQAKVYVNGLLMGTVPLQLELKSSQTYTIEFRKEGYANRTVVLNNSVGAGWIILDVLFGLIPIIVDAATGNWNSLDQDHVSASLEAQQNKFLPGPIEGQTQLGDVLYLKNGSTIKGTILELIPGKTVKIQTSDGSIFVFQLSEVEKIAKADSVR